MKRSYIFAALALATSMTFARDDFDLRPNGDCPPNKSIITGKTGWQVWAIWQCRPQADTRFAKRYFDVYYAIVDPWQIDSLAIFDPVLKAYKAGDTWKASDLGKALIQIPVTDPIFAKSVVEASQAIVPTWVANYVSTTTGKPCACDVQNSTVNGVLKCPLASNPTGSLEVCRGQ